MIKHTFFYLLIISSVLCACTKPPDFPEEPTIELISIENNPIRQNFVDSAFVTVKFTDGDGNIGSEDNAIRDIFLKDTRLSQLNNPLITFTMPEVPALGSENGISGEIRFPIGTCCEPIEGINSCFPVPDNMPEFQRDTVVYEMYIEDRAGNRSNTITLDPIFLLCN